MPTEIAIRPQEQMPERIEKLLLGGDLSQMSVEDRLVFYHARCRAANLNPLCRPFAYTKVKGGGVVLYALKECAEQLNAMHGISHTLTGTIQDEKGGVIEVMVQATCRDGRTTVDVGAVSTVGLKGEDLANARMKAFTKAKRRSTLSLCGLGDMMDESELDTVATIRCNDKGTPLAIDNGTGHGSGKYCTDEEAKTCVDAIDRYRVTRNMMWFDRWTDKATGEVPEGVTELCPRIYQADNHCAKWAVQAGLIKPESMDETGLKPSQLGKLTGIIYKATPNKLKNELKHYFDELERVAVQALHGKHPELFGADDDDVPDLGDAPKSEEAIADDEWEDGRE